MNTTQVYRTVGRISDAKGPGYYLLLIGFEYFHCKSSGDCQFNSLSYLEVQKKLQLKTLVWTHLKKLKLHFSINEPAKKVSALLKQAPNHLSNND